MANSFQAMSQNVFYQDTLRPQSFTSTGAGLAVDATSIAGNLMSAYLSVGAVNTFTSLNVKIQASTDSAFTTPVDITGATFTAVTAANTSQIIDFAVPTVTDTANSPYIYVRAYATLVGTSALVHCAFMGGLKFTSSTGQVGGPQTLN